MKTHMLNTEEHLLVIHALESLMNIPTPHPETPEERAQRLAPAARLRAELREAMDMGYYDDAHVFIDRMLRHEREKTLDNILRVLYPALEDRSQTRKTLRALIQQTFYKIKFERQHYDPLYLQRKRAEEHLQRQQENDEAPPGTPLSSDGASKADAGGPPTPYDHPS